MPRASNPAAISIWGIQMIILRKSGPIIVLFAGIMFILRPDLQKKMFSTKWEYIIISFPDSELEEGMNKLGEEGWELVFARRAITGSGEFTRGVYEMIFRRKK